MSLNTLSLAVVGARYPNKKRGNREFEIAVCQPGEAVELVHEPRNPADANAIAVFSVRGIQMGYVSADRTIFIHRAWQAGDPVRAVFQSGYDGGAWIRVTLDGLVPILPVVPGISNVSEGHPRRRLPSAEGADPDSEFWPDEFPADD